jgi:hypothetical protein
MAERLQCGVLTSQPPSRQGRFIVKEDLSHDALIEQPAIELFDEFPLILGNPPLVCYSADVSGDLG